MRDPPPSDQLLSVEAQASTRSAEADAFFDRLMETECAYVWTSLRRLGVAPSDCEDLMQEVFFRVHRALPSLDSTRPVRPWLFGFAMRVASEHRRLARHKREVRTEVEVADAQAAADDAMVAAQRRRVISEALEAVDLDKRAVLILHDFDDTPVPDIARVLGIAEGTAYSRLRSARTQLAAAVRRLVARRDAMSDSKLDPVEPELRVWVDAERGHLEPVPAEVRARLEPAVRARIALGVAGGGSQGSPAESGGGALRLVRAHPAASVLLALCVGAVGGALLRGAPRETVVYVDRASPLSSAVAVAVAPALSASAESPSVAPALPSSAPAVLSAGPQADESAERVLLDAARSALVHGDPDGSWDALRKHERRFPRGALAEEREALAVRTLASLGRGPEAKRRLEGLRRQYPHSVFLPAAESALNTMTEDAGG